MKRQKLRPLRPLRRLRHLPHQRHKATLPTIREAAQVPVFLADHKDVNKGDFVVVAASVVIPVIGFVYVRLMGTIMRRAGVPPMEEVSSLKMPEPAAPGEAIELRKAA